jgi:hypothetical protein
MRPTGGAEGFDQICRRERITYEQALSTSAIAWLSTSRESM